MDSRVCNIGPSTFMTDFGIHSLFRRLNASLDQKGQIPFFPNNNPCFANLLGSIQNKQFNNLFIPTIPNEPESLPLNLNTGFPSLFNKVPYKNLINVDQPHLLEEIPTNHSLPPKIQDRENDNIQYHIRNYNHQQQYLQKLEFEENVKATTQARRKFWLPAEDAQLMELVNIYGEKWSKIASVMQGRTGKQIRDRYINSLKPGIRQDAWTPAEDELLIRLYRKIGNKWSKIAHCLKGRTENQVKNRFRTYLKRKIRKSVFANIDSEVVSDSVKYDGEKFENEAHLDSRNIKGFESIHSLESELSGPRKRLHVEECNCQKQRFMNNYLPVSAVASNNVNFMMHSNEIRKGIVLNEPTNYSERRVCVPKLISNEELSPECLKEELSSTNNGGSDVKEEYIVVKKENIQYY